MNTATLDTIVITLFADDRPGIIRVVSDTVLKYNGSWQASSLSRLCGFFTGIVHIEVTKENRSRLEAALMALAEDDIKVTIQGKAKMTEDNAEINGIYVMIEANDRPGIVSEITQALSDASVNVDNIDTEVTSASMAGYMLFKAHLSLAMPDDMSESDLEAILEDVSDDLMVSILEE